MGAGDGNALTLGRLVADETSGLSRPSPPTDPEESRVIPFLENPEPGLWSVTRSVVAV